jgi:quinol monooxygenase YgiN
MNETRVPARSVLFLQAKPGMRDQLVEVFRRIDIPGNALLQEGCLSVEVQVPPDEDGPLLVTALWSHRAAYDGWLANPWREYSGRARPVPRRGESRRHLRHRARRRRRLRRRGGGVKGHE